MNFPARLALGFTVAAACNTLGTINNERVDKFVRDEFQLSAATAAVSA